MVMRQLVPKPWLRARLEEHLLMALATPLYLVQPVEQVIETLIREAERLGYTQQARRLLVIRALVMMREGLGRVGGRLASVIETMVNAEKLGVDPGISVLHVLRDLDDSLRTLGNDYRDLVILLDTLIVLTLAITPMVIVIIGQSLNLDTAPYLALNYGMAAPTTLALTWNLDPGLLNIDRRLLTALGIAAAAAPPTYIVTHSIAIAWLAMAATFLALTIRWYVNHNLRLSMLSRRAMEAVMRASITARGLMLTPSNWIEEFVGEYSRVIAMTGMGRSDVLSVAVTSITHVINMVMGSRRVGAVSAVVSTSFIITLLAVTRVVITQVPGGESLMVLLLPAAILGSFFSGYALDSFVTGIYATIPAIITYIVLTTP